MDFDFWFKILGIMLLFVCDIKFEVDCFFLEGLDCLFFVLFGFFFMFLVYLVIFEGIVVEVIWFSGW